jgi:integration host factor subunit alpha
LTPFPPSVIVRVQKAENKGFIVVGGRHEEEHQVALTKEKIINSIYNQVGLSKSQSRFVVEKLFEIVKETLESGEDLLVSGFGKFVVKEKSERRGRNPQTTEDLQLRARRVVVFKTSGVLRDKINLES